MKTPFFLFFCFCFFLPLVLWPRIPRKNCSREGAVGGKCECTGRSGREGEESVSPRREEEMKGAPSAGKSKTSEMLGN